MQRSAPPAAKEPPFEPLELDEICAPAPSAAAASAPQQDGASEAREASEEQLGEEEDAGSSFAKLFGTVVSARKAADASTAALFEAELRATLLARVAYDEQGEPRFALGAAGRMALKRRLTARRVSSSAEQLIAGAIADGTLLRHGHDGADLAASPALAASLRHALEEEEAAQEALLADLVERTRDGIVRAARSAARNATAARGDLKWPEWTIGITRLGKEFGGTPFCRLGFNCGAVATMTRQGHVCSLFATEAERELCPAVFAR